MTDAEAAELIGRDRESHQRDLFDNIERGAYPRWKMYIQIMSEAAAMSHKHNPFDLTKVWPHAEYPLIEVGELELNRNPENFFAEVEQASFSPANIVPGIGFSPDKMLQARLFSYGDAARYRLGVNHHQIPVNTPRCPVHSFHRDGAMRIDGNYGAAKSYVPNSDNAWDEQPGFREPMLSLDGPAGRFDHRVDEDHYEQPGNLYRLMTEGEKAALISNTARSMAAVSVKIQSRHVAHCRRADRDYGDRLSHALGLGENPCEACACPGADICGSPCQ